MDLCVLQKGNIPKSKKSTLLMYVLRLDTNKYMVAFDGYEGEVNYLVS